MSPYLEIERVMTVMVFLLLFISVLIKIGKKI